MLEVAHTHTAWFNIPHACTTLAGDETAIRLNLSCHVTSRYNFAWCVNQPFPCTRVYYSATDWCILCSWVDSELKTASNKPPVLRVTSLGEELTNSTVSSVKPGELLFFVKWIKICHPMIVSQSAKYDNLQPYHIGEHLPFPKALVRHLVIIHLWSLSPIYGWTLSTGTICNELEMYVKFPRLWRSLVGGGSHWPEQQKKCRRNPFGAFFHTKSCMLCPSSKKLEQMIVELRHDEESLIINFSILAFKGS